MPVKEFHGHMYNKIYSNSFGLVMIRLSGKAALIIIFLFVIISNAFASPDFEKLKAKIRKDYSSVIHISQQELIKDMSLKPNILLFDVREKAEYKVSHIKSARRVSPSIWTSSFINKYGSEVKGKKIVFYCSVGVRSSRLAKQLKKELLSLGAVSVSNLEGGIFDWHNSALILKNQGGYTQFVHPYSKYWGQLLKRPSLIRQSSE